MILIADTSPLISLILVGQLNILEKIFGDYYIPQTVWDELQSHNEIKSYRNEINTLSTKIRKTSSFYLPISGIDKGETEAIILYKEMNADLLLIDDRKAREVAELLQIKCIGTLAILLRAKELELIHELKPIFKTFLENDRYYSRKLLNELLLKSSETAL